jgi:hypothetical protein
MREIKSSQIAIRVSKAEREKFFLLSSIEKKPVSRIIKDLVDKELKSRKFNATDFRKMPKEIRIKFLKQMTDEALPVYNKYKNELHVDETGDGIDE